MVSMMGWGKTPTDPMPMGVKEKSFWQNE